MGKDSTLKGRNMRESYTVAIPLDLWYGPVMKSICSATKPMKVQIVEGGGGYIHQRNIIWLHSLNYDVYNPWYSILSPLSIPHKQTILQRECTFYPSEWSFVYNCWSASPTMAGRVAYRQTCMVGYKFTQGQIINKKWGFKQCHLFLHVIWPLFRVLTFVGAIMICLHVYDLCVSYYLCVSHLYGLPYQVCDLALTMQMSIVRILNEYCLSIYAIFG